MPTEVTLSESLPSAGIILRSVQSADTIDKTYTDSVFKLQRSGHKGRCFNGIDDASIADLTIAETDLTSIVFRAGGA